MLLLEPPPTPLDLKWRMLGIPVRVHPLFWLIALLLGLGLPLVYLPVWVICVFVSILIHELGHVLAGKLFGSQGHILLYSFGGLAIGSGRLPERWQRIAVSLAGPAAQFLLAFLLAIPYVGYAAARGPDGIEFLDYLFGILFGINIFWAVLNLMPIWPLDGGQVSREIFQALMPADGLRISLIVSLVFAVLLAVAGLALGPFTVILFGMLAFASWQLLSLLPPRQQQV